MVFEIYFGFENLVTKEASKHKIEFFTIMYSSDMHSQLSHWLECLVAKVTFMALGFMG